MAETDASAAEIAEGGWLLVELEASCAPEDLVLGHQLIMCGQHLVNGLGLFGGGLALGGGGGGGPGWATEGQLSGCMVRVNPAGGGGVINWTGGGGGGVRGGWRNVL